MSDTPRTDKHLKPDCPQCGYSCSAVSRSDVSPDFARQLERELAQAQEQLREAREVGNEYIKLTDPVIDRLTKDCDALQTRAESAEAKSHELAAQAAVIKDILVKQFDRMDRAREIMFKPEIANWGMLDTKLDREALANIPAESEKLVRLEEKYNELLYSVAKKFPGESRHETALRYIRIMESSVDNKAYRDLRGVE